MRVAGQRVWGWGIKFFMPMWAITSCWHGGSLAWPGLVLQTALELHGQRGALVCPAAAPVGTSTGARVCSWELPASHLLFKGLSQRPGEIFPDVRLLAHQYVSEDRALDPAPGTAPCPVPLSREGAAVSQTPGAAPCRFLAHS